MSDYQEEAATGEVSGKTASKRYLILTLVTFVVIGLWISHSYGEEASQFNYGFSAFGGRGEAWHVKPHFEVYGFLPRVDWNVYRILSLELEGNFSYWNIAAQKDFYFFGGNINILFKPIQWKWGSLFMLVGGGIGYDSARNKVSEIDTRVVEGFSKQARAFSITLGKDRH